jgi:hypothetical protein
MKAIFSHCHIHGVGLGRDIYLKVLNKGALELISCPYMVRVSQLPLKRSVLDTFCINKTLSICGVLFHTRVSCSCTIRTLSPGIRGGITARADWRLRTTWSFKIKLFRAQLDQGFVCTHRRLFTKTVFGTGITNDINKNILFAWRHWSFFAFLKN